MVTDTTMGSMEAEYETDPGLSIGTLNYPSSRSSKLEVKFIKKVIDTMLGSIKVK